MCYATLIFGLSPVLRQSADFNMAASMIKVVHRANFCRLLLPAARLGQFYSTESTPSVVGKQEKELEVLEEDGKVKNCTKTVRLKDDLS